MDSGEDKNTKYVGRPVSEYKDIMWDNFSVPDYLIS